MMKHIKKKFNGLHAFSLSLGAVLIALLALYLIGVAFFSSHFGFNTTINGASYSLKTAKQVEEQISEDIKAYGLQIYGRENLSRTFYAADVGMTYVSNGQIWRALDEQNEWLWFARLFTNPQDIAATPSIRLDIPLFNQALERSSFYKDENMREPSDARPVFEGSGYVVGQEYKGTLLDKEKTKMIVFKALHAQDATLYLDETGCYANPDIYSNNAELIKAVETYNQYVPFSITYDFGTYTEVLDGSVSMDWINIDNQGVGTLNKAAVKAWVAEFGKRHDTVGSKREFVAITGEKIEVNGGTYGWEVDEEAELDAIITAYNNHTGETREPHYVQRAALRAEPGKPDWGSSYLELNLTTQHMYYIVDGAIQFESDVVTGRPGRSATPPGIYSILEMLSPAVLVGEIQSDGKPEYRTRVSYWMRMTWAGHGFHDATWQPWFGGTRYIYGGSHGCINMPYKNAQTLYGMIQVGLPVISHY